MARFGVATSKKSSGGTATAEQPRTRSNPPVAISHDAVARRAFEVWVRKGKPLGQDYQNWTEAEAQLRAEGARH
jgi:hypothetical protein